METERVSIRAVSGDEEGRKRVDKVEVTEGVQLKPDTIRYIEKKLHDKGIQRMERHPVDGLPLVHGPPKSGHGGKFTWEGPCPEVEAELDPVPPAIDSQGSQLRRRRRRRRRRARWAPHRTSGGGQGSRDKGRHL
ncbi:hypothetical protein IHE45_10G095100 [Dioscorea alata]|uniref:Uncharacterized protein n=1 Tax=Dioscorea alata TaxID=55571 RepID=A0ACB7VD60_DIOAL|nr:hypothetical protein IHE45_10G095100 [Dioscorea alata]